MILTFGSAMCAASQSVETSGSSVAVMDAVSGISLDRHGRACPGHPRLHFRRTRTWMPGTRPGMTVVVLATSPLLLRFPLFDRPAGVAPGGKAAAHMGDRLQAHVLCGLGCQSRAHAAGAVEDELLVFLEDRLCIGARGIDPELQHAAGAGERAGNPAVALDLAGVADIDDDDIGALR